jgi:hypothetical protein
MKTYSLEELTDQYIGKRGTSKRERFEQELRLELLENEIINETNITNIWADCCFRIFVDPMQCDMEIS